MEKKTTKERLEDISGFEIQGKPINENGLIIMNSLLTKFDEKRKMILNNPFTK